jgi:hypothetical protein
MSVRTVKQSQILLKILDYFEVAAKVGEDVPEAHVQEISSLIDVLLSRLIIPAVGTFTQAPATIAPQPATPTHFTSVFK